MVFELFRVTFPDKEADMIWVLLLCFYVLMYRFTLSCRFWL